MTSERTTTTHGHTATTKENGHMTVTKTAKKKDAAYEVITQAILDKLESGTVPWRKPWVSEAPRNLRSKKAYRGINHFLLSLSEYSNPYWLTYKQAKEFGGQVRKGEKSTPVVFWKWFENATEDEETGEVTISRRPMLRYYRIFNLEQIDGIKEDKIPAWGVEAEHDFQPVEAAEGIIGAMPQCPIIKTEGQRACYNVRSDVVSMPDTKLFKGDEAYYGTLFHELGHATGAEARLNRFNADDTVNFGSADYSKEELIAEMTAAFLCDACGIVQATLDNSAAYIQGWLKKLKNEPRMVVYAAAQAQKAADFIQGINWDKK
jgi:antirestriction protein ArdC